MRLSLLLLALAAALAGCKSSSGESTRYSWQKDAPAPAVDNTRTVVRAIRPEYSLVELSPLEKRDAGVRLQLTKAGKNFAVEIVRSDDQGAVVVILAGQASVPELKVGDDLALAVLAQ